MTIPEQKGKTVKRGERYGKEKVNQISKFCKSYQFPKNKANCIVMEEKSILPVGY